MILSFIKVPFVLLGWLIILVSPFTKRWTLRFHLTNGRAITYVLAFAWLSKPSQKKVQEVIDFLADMDFKTTTTAVRFNLELPEGHRRIVVNPANLAAVEVIKG